MFKKDCFIGQRVCEIANPTVTGYIIEVDDAMYPIAIRYDDGSEGCYYASEVEPVSDQSK